MKLSGERLQAPASIWEKQTKNDSVVFMHTETGKRVITEDLVLSFCSCMAFRVEEAKASLKSFEYAVLHNWTINLDNKTYTGKFVDCAKLAERYELRRFLAILICWKNEQLPENVNTNGLESIIEKLSMDTPEFFAAMSNDLDALQLTKSKGQLQTRITAAQESMNNKINQNPFDNNHSKINSLSNY